MSEHNEDRQLAEDQVFALARDLAQRIRWEQETGVFGFSDHPDDTTATPAAPSPQLAGSPTSGTNSARALRELREEIGECTRCPLHQGRNKLVFGVGNPDADLVFVGEGPGQEEDLQGEPFVGAAGQLLTKIIQAMGLSRQQVYICNVVKCRPPGNRDPEPIEASTCGPFMKRQLEVINPKVVVALGRQAAHYLLQTDLTMGRLRGKFHELGTMMVMPTYHPSYLLRNPEAKRPVWEDMQQVMAKLNPTGGREK